MSYIIYAILIGIIVYLYTRPKQLPSTSILPQLQKIARVDIQVDYHKIFGTSTMEYMTDKELENTSLADKQKMIAFDSVIRVECLGSRTVLVFSHDLETALSEAYKKLQA